jgi:hydroxyacylglutathione hydrolase
MRITPIRSEGLAALSYFVSSENEAMVIDPRRDAVVYENLAKENGNKITHIFETHRNEDYVIGSLELQSLHPGSEIGHSKATKFGYGDINIDDGETFQIGKMHVTCLNTPGHTLDSMCYIVADSSVGSDPIVAFTGDTLFVNEVGRTDLVDITKHAEMSELLYESLHEKVLKLGDGVIIYPGHGAGSVCGGNIGEREFSTIGFEKQNNIWLDMSKDDFIKAKVNQGLTLSSYFKHCEKLNTEGPPLVSHLPPPEALDVDSFESLLGEQNHRAIDVRPPPDFLDAHIPGTINLSLTNMGLLAGWALRPDQSFSLILDNPENLDEVRSYLLRVGYDKVIGYLKDGLTAWTKSGRALESISIIATDEMHEILDKKTIELYDVREPHEFESEHIADSHNLPLTAIGSTIEYDIPNQPLAVICPSGFRSTTAASLLKNAGYNDIRVVLDGLKEWKQKGYPLSTTLSMS